MGQMSLSLQLEMNTAMWLSEPAPEKEACVFYLSKPVKKPGPLGSCPETLFLHSIKEKKIILTVPKHLLLPLQPP